jgi:DNA-directed RNA polymerase specialized sigma subunit
VGRKNNVVIEVKDYYMSQAEVAKALGLTRSEVQQAETSGLKKLKRSGKLRRFLGAKE